MKISCVLSHQAESIRKFVRLKIGTELISSQPRIFVIKQSHTRWQTRENHALDASTWCFTILGNFQFPNYNWTINDFAIHFIIRPIDYFNWFACYWCATQLGRFANVDEQRNLWDISSMASMVESHTRTQLVFGKRLISSSSLATNFFPRRLWNRCLKCHKHRLTFQMNNDSKHNQIEKRKNFQNLYLALFRQCCPLTHSITDEKKTESKIN